DQRQGPAAPPRRLLDADRNEHHPSLRRDGLKRLSEEHRARARPPRHFQRVFPLHSRSRRPSARALHQRLFYRGSRPRTAALVAQGSAAANAVGRACAALLVRAGFAVHGPAGPRTAVRRRRDGFGLKLMSSARLATFFLNGAIKYGAVVDAGVVDLSARHGKDYPTLREVIAAGALMRLAEGAASRSPDHALEAATWLPPIPQPEKIICIGVN